MPISSRWRRAASASDERRTPRSQTIFRVHEPFHVSGDATRVRPRAIASRAPPFHSAWREHDADRRKVRYLYFDARRIAKVRGLIIYPPKKIFSARLAFYGGLFAERHGKFREYSDRIFERFWKQELDVENRGAISAIITEVGLDAAEFLNYADTTARADLDACFAEADGDKVFGVPTFIVDGEPFWGEDRVEWVIRKLDQMGLRR